MKASQRHKEHMDRVRAVQRRGALERIEAKIRWYEEWERAIRERRQIGQHEPEDPPLGDHEREQLRVLREQRAELLHSMIDAGQL